MWNKFLQRFAEAQGAQAAPPLPTFSGLRPKSGVSQCLGVGAEQESVLMVPVAEETPPPPRPPGSGLSGSGSVCAESASSHSVAQETLVDVDSWKFIYTKIDRHVNKPESLSLPQFRSSSPSVE